MYVERVPLSEMTYERFHDDFLLTRRRLVIEEAYKSSPLVTTSSKGNDDGEEGGWSLQRIRRLYGDVMLPKYMINLKKGANQNFSHKTGQRLAISSTIPLQEERKRRYSFTMAIFQGRKQFVLFHPSEKQLPCLANPIAASRYGVDAFSPDFERCPDEARTKPLFASVGPGDIFFVPGGTPHAARNMEDGIGISQNFLTLSDYDAYFEYGPRGHEENYRERRHPRLRLPPLEMLRWKPTLSP